MGRGKETREREKGKPTQREKKTHPVPNLITVLVVDKERRVYGSKEQCGELQNVVVGGVRGNIQPQVFAADIGERNAHLPGHTSGV